LKLFEKATYILKLLLSRLKKFFRQPYEPDFLLIGAQKSGSTSLHYYLNQHPNIQGSVPKEIHYFDRHIHFGKSVKWYEKHFQKSASDKVLNFEATPNYIFNPECPRLIHEHYPDIKLILILRNPKARALSAYNMYRDFFERKAFRLVKSKPKPGLENPIYAHLFKGRSTFPSIEEVFEFEKQALANGQIAEPAIFRRGLYVEQIERYLKYFKPEQLLILSFEDLIHDLSSSLNQVYKFLGVSNFPFEKLDTRVINKRDYKKNMDQSLLDQLDEFYYEPNKRLYELVGRKFEWT